MTRIERNKLLFRKSSCLHCLPIYIVVLFLAFEQYQGSNASHLDNIGASCRSRVWIDLGQPMSPVNIHTLKDYTFETPAPNGPYSMVSNSLWGSQRLLHPEGLNRLLNRRCEAELFELAVVFSFSEEQSTSLFIFSSIDQNKTKLTTPTFRCGGPSFLLS